MEEEGMTITMTPVEKLLALEEIKMLRHRWSRYVDFGMVPRIRELLADDAVLDLTGVKVRGLDPAKQPKGGNGADEIVKTVTMIASMPGPHVHVATMPEIEFISDTTATGIWRQESYIAAAMRLGAGRLGIYYGLLEDEYVKRDGKWLFKSLKVSVDALL